MIRSQVSTFGENWSCGPSSSALRLPIFSVPLRDMIHLAGIPIYQKMPMMMLYGMVHIDTYVSLALSM